MKIADKLISLILMAAGVVVWSIDYFIVKVIANIGTWLAGVFNAPEGIGMGITLLCLIPLLGIMMIIAVIGGFLISLGLRLLLE